MNQPEITSSVFSPVQPQFEQLAFLCTELWNEANGDDLAISKRVFDWLCRRGQNDNRTLWVAHQVGVPVGFLLTSECEAQSAVILEAIAVRPTAQRQGIGQQLVQALQKNYEAHQMLQTIQIGDGQEGILPGVPIHSTALQFFAKQGFINDAQTREHGYLDVAVYQPPKTLTELPAAVRPAQAGQQSAILSFLENHPASASTRLRQFVENGKRLFDLMLLWTEEGVNGICQLGFEDSPLPIELGFAYRLPRPWAQIGAIILADDKGDEYCSLLLDAALRRLHNTGVNSVISTAHLSQTVREQFSVQTYQSFQSMHKQVASL